MKLDTPPKVSVIIPVFNAGEALRGSVASVLGQRDTRLELILVDDGSTDGSSDLCDQIASEDDRVVVLHKSNGGVSSARNLGIANATGDYLTFVDADDALVPGALAKVVQRLVETGAELACFGMTFVYHDGERVIQRSVKAVQQDMVISVPRELRDSFFELFRLNYWSSVWNKVYSTSFIREHAILFDTQMAILEDLDFVLACLSSASTVAVMAEPMYDYLNDLTQRPSSRRPDIDYLRNFHLLEDRLKELSAVVGFGSPGDLGRLQAMLFRFYLIGLEMIFERRMAPWCKIHRLRRYMSDERVVRAARSASGGRRGVEIVARLVGKQRVLAVFLFLLVWTWRKRAQRRLRVIASRAGSVSRR